MKEILGGLDIDIICQMISEFHNPSGIIQEDAYIRKVTREIYQKESVNVGEMMLVVVHCAKVLADHVTKTI